MAQLKVQQKKSTIGCKANQRETLRTLGLKRIGDVVVKEDRPEIRGMVQTVRHLVTVDDLVAKGAVRKNQPVKVLGQGDISVAVQISANAFSSSAKEKIEAAGGTATVA